MSNFSFTPANTELEQNKRQLEKDREAFLGRVFLINAINNLEELFPSHLEKLLNTKKWKTNPNIEKYLSDNEKLNQEFFATPLSQKEYVDLVNHIYVDMAIYTGKKPEENAEYQRRLLSKEESAYQNPKAKQFLFEELAKTQLNRYRNDPEWERGVKHLIYKNKVEKICSYFDDEPLKHELLNDAGWDRVSSYNQLENLARIALAAPKTREEYQERIKKLNDTVPLKDFGKLYNREDWKTKASIALLIDEENAVFYQAQVVNREDYGDSPFRSAKVVQHVLKQLEERKEMLEKAAQQVKELTQTQTNTGGTSLRRR